MKNTVLTWLNEHAPILIASGLGGWIQIYFTKKKTKKKTSFFDLVMNILIALFVGWGASEIATLLHREEWAIIVAMLTGISSNSILNTYLNNEVSIWKQILSLRFNINISDKEKD